MPKIRIKNGKIFQFLLSISIVVGSVIGVGIFFKNETIISWSQGSAVTVLLTWISASIVAVALAFSFMEISRKTHSNNTGIGEFSTLIINKKMGSHTKLGWNFFYYVMFLMTIGSYISNYLAQIITGNPINNTYVVLIGASVIVLLFVSFNILLPRIAEWVQIHAMFIKLIPLFVAAIGGVVTIFLLSKFDNWWDSANTPIINEKLKNETAGFDQLSLIFFLLPAALFAYDSFLNGTNIAENVDKRYVSFALAGGMLFIATIYILTTLAILNTGTLKVEDALVTMFGGDPQHLTTGFWTLKLMIQIVILISAAGVANGFSIVWIRSFTKVLKNPSTKNLFIFTFSFFLITAVPLLVVSFLYEALNWNPGIGIQLFDAMSNIVTIVGFTIYGTVLSIGAIKNWMGKKIADEGRRIFAKWFSYVAMFASIIIYIVLGYQFFYIFLYKSLSEPFKLLGGVHNWVYALLGIIYMVYYVAAPFVAMRIIPQHFSSEVIIKPEVVKLKT